MTFNKTQYWKNRAEGKRGQGVVTVPTADTTDPEYLKHNAEGAHLAQTSQGIVRVNRTTARRKYVDHRLTSKTARIKSDEETRAVADRVKRKEAGERERIMRLQEAA
ncbi:hypothetical protein [Mycolicibacterium neoaurum]|uniref:hypothetical protein n=1 Tax=Mycolicibacterium neoaurum TaxID=1795 RepID=UPI001F4CA8B4|nr:hypothetical protein [Mycolicibacterium neoaurum]